MLLESRDIIANVVCHTCVIRRRLSAHTCALLSLESRIAGTIHRFSVREHERGPNVDDQMVQIHVNLHKHVLTKTGVKCEIRNFYFKLTSSLLKDATF